MALVAVWPLAAAPAASPAACSGVQLTPASNLSAVVGQHTDGTTYCLAAGVYRVTAPIAAGAGDRFVGAPGAIVDGSRRTTGWVKNGSVWLLGGQTQGPTQNLAGWGSQKMMYPQSGYSDDLFYDGRALWKVGVKRNGVVVGSAPSTVGPGEYFMDYDANRITLGSNPTGHVVEVTAATAGFTGHGSNVTITGLEIRKIAGTAIDAGGTGWTVTNDEIDLNHVAGISIDAGMTVMNDHVHHNGQYGIKGQGDNLLLSGNEVDNNDFAKLMMPDGSCWAAGGTKIVNSKNVVIRSNHYHDNLCNGLWVDILSSGALVEDNVSEHNRADGIRFEIAYNVTASGNVSRDNGRGGITIVNTPGATINGNTVTGNLGGGIMFSNTGRTDPSSPLGPHQVRDEQVYDNDVSLSGTQNVGIQSSSGTAVFTSWNNRFWNNRYTVPDGSGRWFLWDGTRVTWAAWRGAGQDAGGTLTVGS